MDQALPKTLIFDIGRSWTKSFILNFSDNKVVIEKRLSLPTSVGDLSFAYDKLLEKIKLPKGTQTIVTGSLPEAETLAKNVDAIYVSEEDAKTSFADYLNSVGFKKVIILDAGDYSFSPITKINQLGAFVISEVSEIDIENYFGNKSLNPRSIPVNSLQLELEEAFLRVAFASNSSFVSAKNVVNAVITGSFFSLTPHKSKLGLIIADILAAGRVAQVKLDTKLFAHSFGALLKHNPKVAALSVDFIEDLGGFISFGGKGKIMLDYGYTESQELEIVEDEIALIPTTAKQEIKIVDFSTKDNFTLHGGLFGILLDGRLKPLRLAFGRAESRETMRRWSSAITKMEMIE